MADNDDLMIEVTASTKGADSGLKKLLDTLGEFQTQIEKVAPSLSKFTKELDSITAGSKAFAMLERLTKGTGELTQAGKKAESAEAMYQARLDRSTVSMERSRIASEKLASARQKMQEYAAIDAHNQSVFSMSPEEYKKNGYDHTAVSNNTPAETWASPDAGAPSMKYNSANIQAQMDAFTAKIAGKTPKINIDTEAATAEVRKIGEYIDSLTPKMSSMSETAQAQFNSLAEKLTLVSQRIDNQRMLYSRLGSESAKVAQEQGEGSMANLRLEKQMLSSSNATQRLTEQQEKLKIQLSEVGDESIKAGDTMEKSAKKSTSAWDNTLRMMEKMFIRIAAFRIFSAISKGIVTGIQDMAQASGQANATMSALATNSLYLKNSIGAALMPVLQSLIPVLNQVTDAIADVFNNIAMLTARIFDHSETAVIATRASVNYAGTISKTGDNASEANKKVKELQNSIMGFDEINKLTAPTDAIPKVPKDKNPGMPDYGDMFKTVKIAPWADKVGQIVDNIKKSLADVTAVVSGALLAVGAILLLTGVNIPLGLGLMATGAVGLASDISANWKSMTTPLLNTLTTITATVGGFLLALGTIMALSGANIPLGIGLMAAGAVSLGTAVALNWESTKANVSTTLSGITGLISGASLAVGGMLAFTGVNVPLGIGLMAVGAAGLASAVALNWSGMDAKIKGTISTITSIVGGAMLAVGGILTFSGASPALGIAMMAVGASSLAATVAVNWNGMSSQLKSTLTTITTTVGGFMLALGAVFAFSGASIPLGIALMAAGAVSIGTVAAMNWNSVTSSVSNVAKVITGIVSGALIAFGAVLAFSGVNIPLGIGLMVAGGAGLASSANIDWNYIPRKFGEAWQLTKDKWNGAGSWFGGIWNTIISKFKPNMISSGFQSAWNALTSWKIPMPHIWWGSGAAASGWVKDALSALHLPTSLPSFNIDWYAKGGLFDTPSVVGIGEAGPEAALPLNDKVFSQIAQGIVHNGGSSSDVDMRNQISEISKQIAALKEAILNRPVKLYTDDRTIAESAKRGSTEIARQYRLAT